VCNANHVASGDRVAPSENATRKRENGVVDGKNVGAASTSSVDETTSRTSPPDAGMLRTQELLTSFEDRSQGARASSTRSRGRAIFEFDHSHNATKESLTRAT
jgi:hypothetical protein